MVDHRVVTRERIVSARRIAELTDDLLVVCLGAGDDIDGEHLSHLFGRVRPTRRILEAVTEREIECDHGSTRRFRTRGGARRPLPIGREVIGCGEAGEGEAKDSDGEGRCEPDRMLPSAGLTRSGEPGRPLLLALGGRG